MADDIKKETLLYERDAEREKQISEEEKWLERNSWLDEKEEKLAGGAVYGYPVGRSATTSISPELNPDEVLGGTFTLSVLGVVDGFTPILNSGQSAILGVGRSTEKPVVQRKEIVIREMSTVSLTVDHQVIDGAVAVQFLRRLQQLIERPKSLFS